MQSNTPLSLRDHASNRPLLSDQDLARAVQGAASLSAVLTDAALNELEARRDDMAQMQWQLLREHLAVISEQLQAGDRKVLELEERLEQQRIAFDASQQHSAAEVRRLLNKEANEREQAVRELTAALSVG